MKLETQATVLEQINKAHPAARTVGVVFVHGVGSQPQSSGLREQADPLIRWLRRWHEAAAREREKTGQPASQDEFTVVSSLLSYGEDIDGPARVRVHLPGYTVTGDRREAAKQLAKDRAEEQKHHQGSTDQTPVDLRPDGYHSENWVMTEAWWAARVSAPALRTMAGWTFKSYWQAWSRTVDWFARQNRAVVDRQRGISELAFRHLPARVVEFPSAVLVAILYLVGGFLLLPVVWALYLVAQLPIPGLEEFVVLRLIRPLLSEGVGDVYTYLHDEPQALHIRRSVEESVHWLVTNENCAHVIVVAHSGGTVVSFDALGNRWRGKDETVCKHDVADLNKVRALVTVGAALSVAWGGGLGPTTRLRLRDPLCAPRPPECLPVCRDETTHHHLSWFDIWASYDLVCAGAQETTGAPGGQKPFESVQVTNGLNVLTDHGGYWENAEEYLPRIAQLIEKPDGRHASRFWDPLRTEWVERRRDRVSTLVAWRLFGMGAFFFALLWRLADGRMTADGRSVLGFVGGIPLVGGAVETVEKLFAGTPAVVGLAGLTLTGAAFWIATSVAVYVAVVRVVYEPWSARDGERSILPSIVVPGSQAFEIVARTIAVFGALLLTASTISAFDWPMVTWSNAVVTAAAFVGWALFWAVAVPRLHKKMTVGQPVYRRAAPLTSP